MNKGGLVDRVAQVTGMSKADVAKVLECTLDTIRDSVAEGEHVTLADFGTFSRKHRNARVARNPRQPQTPIAVPARDLPAFTPGRRFKDLVVGDGQAVTAQGRDGHLTAQDSS
jgi:DNA-binding protein HU-beta